LVRELWKKTKRTKRYSQLKLMLKRLAGRELTLAEEVSIPKVVYGDWTICPEYLSSRSIVYSLGIGDNIGFDIELIQQYGVEIHAFDATPRADQTANAADVPLSFHAYPWVVMAEDGAVTLYQRQNSRGKGSQMYTLNKDAADTGSYVRVEGYSIPTLMSRLGHRQIDLIKIDIEGAEYEVLDSLLAHKIYPRQILVEFHHRFPGFGLAKTAKTIADLRAAGYRIFAVSGSGIEISFVRVPKLPAPVDSHGLSPANA
jgi:FkbM family methyltransferase